MQKFTGKQYLQIDIANNFGKDKLTWDERLAWFNNNESNLEKLADVAESPALYTAGVKAWREVQKGNPIGYPISLDATSSGIQWLSVVTGDAKAASYCNVVNIGKRADAYMLLFHIIQKKLGQSTKIDRLLVKQAVMTAFYGSVKTPKDLFGEHYPTFVETMQEETPACWVLNEYLLNSWDPEATEYSWWMPDGFHAIMPVVDKRYERCIWMGKEYSYRYSVVTPNANGKALGANFTHSIDAFVLRELITRASIDHLKKAYLDKILREKKLTSPIEDNSRTLVKTLWESYKESGILSSRILLHLNSSNLDILEDLEPVKELLSTIPDKSFQIIPIHDCFRILPNYGNSIRELYIRLLYEVARSNLGTYLLKQITGASISKLNKELPDLVLKSEYALS